jgi:hypothetical protein
MNSNAHLTNLCAGVEIMGNEEPVANHVDQIMLRFEKIVNSHKDMHVKMHWITQEQKKARTREVWNMPDYWLGVAYAAYTKGVITNQLFKDVLLALQASGAKSTHFADIVQQVLRGEI